MIVFFQTEKEGLFLKLIDPTDSHALFQLVDSSRSYLREWLPFVDGTQSEGDTLQFIQSAQTQYGRNDGFQAGIWNKDRLLGMVGLHHVNWSNCRTSIGYWLAEDAQGNGFMTAACKAVISFCFEYYHLNRIDLHAAVANRKSCAVAERLGFVQEGTLRDAEWLYDHFVDHAAYSLLQRDWKLS